MKSLSQITDQDLDEVEREAYRSSLYKTAKYLLGYTDITQRTHGGIIRKLESPGRRKLICVPRGTFKSSIGVVSFSIWSLLRNPDLRIMIDSENYVNSKNFVREIAAHLERPEITTLFGRFRSRRNWGEGSLTIAQRSEITKESSVIASGIGANKTSQHMDIIIHDDLNSQKNSQTPEQRKKVIAHYQMNTSILEPDGTMVVIGTRYAEDDIIGWVLQNEVDLSRFTDQELELMGVKRGGGLL